MVPNRYVRVVRSDVCGSTREDGEYFTVRAEDKASSWLIPLSPAELAQVVSQGERLLHAAWLAAARAARAGAHDGPDAPEHEHCGRGCPASGTWGATGVMPPGHHWHWRDAEHTSGYLAHGEPENHRRTA